MRLHGAVLLGAAGLHSRGTAPAFKSYKPLAPTTGHNGQWALFPRTLASLDTTNQNNVVTYSTPGQVVTGKLIGYAVINTPTSNPVKFYSCKFIGISGHTGSTGLADLETSGVGAVFYDCTFNPVAGALQTYLNCIIGHDWTLYRCDLRGGTDGMRSHNTHNGGGAVNTWHYGCYVHDLAGWLVDPSQSNGPSHNDPWQMEGGGNSGGVGSNLLGLVDPAIADGASWSGHGGSSNPLFLGGLQTNSCVQMNNNTGAVPNFVLDGCYLDGGFISLNMANNGAFSSTLHLSLTGNRFGRGQGAQVSGGDGTATLYAKTGTVYDAYSGNVYDDNGHAITARSN